MQGPMTKNRYAGPVKRPPVKKNMQLKMAMCRSLGSLPVYNSLYIHIWLICTSYTGYNINVNISVVYILYIKTNNRTILFERHVYQGTLW